MLYQEKETAILAARMAELVLDWNIGRVKLVLYARDKRTVGVLTFVILRAPPECAYYRMISPECEARLTREGRGHSWPERLDRCLKRLIRLENNEIDLDI
jgi:hypothetical protein